jgi:SWI/SNF-related matrix-associated actin-dependent regulator 1 of chromatin subfamily A
MSFVSTKGDKFWPYQAGGVDFVESHKGVALIGDQMGLGKTVQAIGFFKLHINIRPVVVVCPASVKYNWQNELYKWLPKEKVHVVEGKKVSELPKADWFIINYDILAVVTEWRYRKNQNGIMKKYIKDVGGWIDQLFASGVKAVVGDEIQFISNHQTIRGFSFCKLAKTVKKPLVFLSGTPIRNCPAEFFTALNLLNPQTFSNRWEYLQKYCDPKHNGFGWDYKGLSHGEELHELLKGVMIRREKSQVRKDLPPKVSSIIPMELTAVEKKSYFAADKDFVEWLQSFHNTIETKAQLSHLKQMAYLAKRNAVIEWIQEFLDSGEKLVVFGYHHKVLDDLYNHFHRLAVKIDGSVSSKKRQEAVDTFQSQSKCRHVVAQLQSVVGMNGMQVASAAAFVEYSEIPTDVLQAEDRLPRPGQEADVVNIYHLTAPGTIDDHIISLLETKYCIISQVMDGKVDGSMFGGNIDSDLLDIYKGRGKH